MKVKLTLRNLQELEDALKRYEHEVNATRLSPRTKQAYVLLAKAFVHWLLDDFTPGEQAELRDNRPAS